MGFFNPQMTDQALMCLDLMEFDGKDGVMQKVAQNGTMFEKLMQYLQIAFGFAKNTNDGQLMNMILADMQSLGMQSGAQPGGAPNLPQSENLAGFGKEPANVEKARAKSKNASQPNGDKQ